MKQICLIAALIVSGCYTQFQTSRDDDRSVDAFTDNNQDQNIILLPPPPPPIIIIEFTRSVPSPGPSDVSQVQTVRDFGTTRNGGDNTRVGDRTSNRGR
jgi:hypothetical protein